MAMTISSKNKQTLDQMAVDIISNSTMKLLKDRDWVVLAIPGGRSVRGIFRHLVEERNIGKIPWQNLQIFMADERLVPIDHKDSNFKLAKEIFLDKAVSRGVLPEENVHPFILDTKKADFGVFDYERELKQYATGYDIVVLSAGEDGHIGALYPNHHSVYDESEFFLSMTDSPKPPRDRMTLSTNMLLRSDTAIVLFIDKAKKGAYRAFLDGQLDYRSCPAKLVLSVHDSYVITNLG